MKSKWFSGNVQGWVASSSSNLRLGEIQVGCEGDMSVPMTLLEGKLSAKSLGCVRRGQVVDGMGKRTWPRCLEVCQLQRRGWDECTRLSGSSSNVQHFLFQVLVDVGNVAWAARLDVRLYRCLEQLSVLRQCDAMVAEWLGQSVPLQATQIWDCATYMTSSALAILSSLGVLCRASALCQQSSPLRAQRTSTRHWCDCRCGTFAHESSGRQKCSL